MRGAPALQKPACSCSLNRGKFVLPFSISFISSSMSCSVDTLKPLASIALYMSLILLMLETILAAKIEIIFDNSKSFAVFSR